MPHFIVEKIEFDFTDSMGTMTEQEQEFITDNALGLWWVEEEDDLVDYITDKTGWCISSISYNSNLGLTLLTKPGCMMPKLYLNDVNLWGRFSQYLIELTHQPVFSVIFSISASSGSNHSESTCHNPRVLSIINSCSCSVIVPIESEKSNSMDSTIK